MRQSDTGAERLPIIALEFRIYGGSFDPDEITDRLGLTPTLAFRPGDAITPDGRGKRHRFGWRLRVGELEGLDIQAILRDLQEEIDVSGNLIRQVCNELNVQAVIFCGVRQHDAEISPALIFPPEFIQWVENLGGSIEVDFIF